MIINRKDHRTVIYHGDPQRTVVNCRHPLWWMVVYAPWTLEVDDRPLWWTAVYPDRPLMDGSLPWQTPDGRLSTTGTPGDTPLWWTVVNHQDPDGQSSTLETPMDPVGDGLPYCWTVVSRG